MSTPNAPTTTPPPSTAAQPRKKRGVISHAGATPPKTPAITTTVVPAVSATAVTAAVATTSPATVWWKKKEAAWAAAGIAAGLAVGGGAVYYLGSEPQVDTRKAIIRTLEAEALEKPQTKIRVQGYVHRIGNDLVVTMAYPSLVVDNCGKAHEAHPSVVGVRPAASGQGMLEGTLMLQLHNAHGQTLMYRGDDLLIGGGGAVNGFSMDAFLME